MNKLFISAMTAAALLTAGVTALSTATASAAAAPLSDARIALHFNLAGGQTPENVVDAPGGAFDVTFAKARQVVEITSRGAIRVLATLLAPADGGVHTPALGFPLTSGIVRTSDGTIYFLYATGTADLTGVWRLRPGAAPQRIAALPANGLPNGLAIDPRQRTLYVTDSVLGTIWSVPVSGGKATAWSSSPALASTGFLGANGVKVHDGEVWATDLDQGTIVRIPIRRDGRAGQVHTVATGLDGIDDFIFTGHGDQILAAMVVPSEVALVQPDGSHTIVLTAADGLENATSVALRGDTVYVFSAAYLTAKDPNLLEAHVDFTA